MNAPKVRVEMPATARLSLMTRVLRGLGAAFLLASASTFLVQHWSAGNDILRFGFLLSHTLLLLGAAFFCGGKLSESRSARMFLWTSLSMVPLYFTVMGALLYSQFASAEALSLLPNYALWQAPSKWSAALAVLGAALVIAPSAFLSARALVRRQARIFVGSYLGLSSLLLLPLREAGTIGVLALASAVFALVVERRFFVRDSAMRTLEGWMVRGLLWVPPAILVARTAIFYPATDLFFGAIVFAFGLCAAVLGSGLPAKSKVNGAIEWLSAGVMSFGILYTLDGIGLLDEWGILATLACSGVFLVRSFSSRGHRDGLERWGVVSALLVCLLALVVEENLTAGAVTLVLSSLALASSLLLGRTLLAFFSGLVCVIGAAFVFDLAVGFERVFNWGTLSLLGVMLVLAAGLAERKREDVLAWLRGRAEAG